MPKKKNILSSANYGIQVTGNITSKTIAVGKDHVTAITQDNSTDIEPIKQVFTTIHEAVDRILPDGPEKETAHQAVEKLQGEALKGDKADENTVRNWFDFLIKIAPDMLEVAAATFLNPIQGLSLAFRKVAEQAKVQK